MIERGFNAILFEKISPETKKPSRLNHKIFGNPRKRLPVSEKSHRERKVPVRPKKSRQREKKQAAPRKICLNPFNLVGGTQILTRFRKLIPKSGYSQIIDRIPRVSPETEIIWLYQKKKMDLTPKNLVGD